MGSLFRTERGRSKFVNCNDSPVAIRIYIFKNETMMSADDNHDWDLGFPEDVTKHLLGVVKHIAEIIETKLLNDGQDNVQPSRLYIYYELEDKFYSIYFGYRYKNTITPIGDLRYLIFEGLFFSEIYAFQIVGSNCHLASGCFDVEHCEAEPSFTYEKDDVEILLKGKAKAKKGSKARKQTVLLSDGENSGRKNITWNRKNEAEKILDVVVGDKDIVKAALAEDAKNELAKIKKAENKTSKKRSVSELENKHEDGDIKNVGGEGDADDS